MKKIQPAYKRASIIGTTSIIAIFGIYHTITQRSLRQNTDSFFHSAQTSADNTIITPRQQQIIGVQYALRENNIPQAIHSMPTQIAKDFYNRATLKTLRAYQLMEQNDETYKQVLQEAQEDFKTAESKTTNIYLQQRIKNNTSLSQNIQYIGEIQVCFNDFNTVLDDLAIITDNINQTRNSIQNQLEYIQKNSNTLNKIIGEECKQRIQETFNKSNNALINIAKSIGKHTDIYTKILTEHIDDPSLCIQTNLKPIIQDTQSTKTKLQESQQTYAITDMALQAGNRGILEQMCEQTQDDTLSNQDLEQSLSQLLESLEKSVESTDESKENDKEQSWSDKAQDQWPTSSKPKYIPLTQEEKILLEQAQQNNEQWINSMMQIKKNNYNPSQTLNTIFEIFYGDTSEFNIPWR